MDELAVSLTIVTSAVWIGALAIVGASIALAIISARIRVPILGALTAVPVLVGLLAYSVGITVPAPHPAYAALVAIGLFILGVTAGNPITVYVLEFAAPTTVRAGLHGGILTDASPQDPRGGRGLHPGGHPAEGTDGAAVEVLRGGATIGYLERIAVLGCLAAGRIEGIAVIVAIKGLGRFSDLSSPEARERFIIGTLVSLIWACSTGALLILVL